MRGPGFLLNNGAHCCSQAQSIEGLRAVFGESYPDPVRVVSLGAPIASLVGDTPNENATTHSVEFCGGTHIGNSADIGSIVIVSEESIKAGVRRVSVLTGVQATQANAYADQVEVMLSSSLDKAGVAAVTAALNAKEMPAVRKEAIRSQLAAIKQKLVDAEKQKFAALKQVAVQRAKELVDETPALVVEKLAVGGSSKAISEATKILKKGLPNTAVMFFSVCEEDGQIQCCCVVPKAITMETGLSAKQWVTAIAGCIGVQRAPGGSDQVGQCRGTRPDQVNAATTIAIAYAEERLAK